MENQNELSEQVLERARELVSRLEEGNRDQAKKVLDDLANVREKDLFQELGKLTRELHDTLNGFKLDSRLTSLAEQDIPDAQERLNYVISMTEQAANKTLTAVEESLPVAERLQQRSADVRARWEQFRKRELSADEFRGLSRDLDEFFPEVSDSFQLLQRNLSDVLMAQDFQDLTGQVIRRVITLVKDVEASLVDLIRISGRGNEQLSEVPRHEKQDAGGKGSGPAVPGVDTAEEVIQGQDEVDDLLSSLGF